MSAVCARHSSFRGLH